MKIRIGFVSNSSSSSFICNITGEEYTSMDPSMIDAEMCVCENGHIFLDEFLVGDFKKFEDYDDTENEEDWRNNVPIENCPICSFQYIENDLCVEYIKNVYNMTSDEVFKYMKSKNSRLRKIRHIYWFELLFENKGISKEELIKEIKSKYSNYEEFYKDMK